MKLIMALLLMNSVVMADGNWPTWHGPGQKGIAEGNPPVTWSESENIKWKVALTGSGSSTPVIWGNKMIFQAAVPVKDAEKMLSSLEMEPSKREGIFAAIRDSKKVYSFQVICLDRRNGQKIWNKTVHVAQPHEGHHQDHGYASYSPVTDGKFIWVNFGSRGAYCLDMDGNIKWSQEMPKQKTKLSFGEASSPAVAGDNLIILADQEGDSEIIALNKLTGEVAWRKPRDEQTNWTTPVSAEVDGRIQVIVGGHTFTIGYDAQTGAELWKCGGQTQNVIPTPLIDKGIAYCMSGFRGNTLQAIRLGRKGDLTGTDAIVWEHDKNTSYVPSAVLSDGKIFFCAHNKGSISCLDAATGKVHYTGMKLEGVKQVYASPVSVADKVYFAGRRGAVAVISNASEFKLLAVNKLDDGFDASPVIIGRDLYLKGNKNIYCIAEK